ncbi:helix-turn-helix domain-containing protein [Ideonella sp. A 288]|uniref:helix-turn-helix domain-containing protein n=1 Tax=Ideonella sp. A 288 TaxID=1962181 RepID=UPI000B4B18D5
MDFRPHCVHEQTDPKPKAATSAAGVVSPARRDSKSFGAILFDARTRRALTQRELARRAGVAFSIVSEIENGRRPPPSGEVLHRLSWALGPNAPEADLLKHAARAERQSLGLRISRATPRHVADLLRDISRLGHQLSTRQVAAIRTSLTEEAMK